LVILIEAACPPLFHGAGAGLAWLAAPLVLPAEIQEVSHQIEQWRNTRRHRMPMPEPLWIVAANLARQYGVARVARFLRLDYYSPKERLKPPEGQQITVREFPTFIELPSDRDSRSRMQS